MFFFGGGDGEAVSFRSLDLWTVIVKIRISEEKPRHVVMDFLPFRDLNPIMRHRSWKYSNLDAGLASK